MITRSVVAALLLFLLASVSLAKDPGPSDDYLYDQVRIKLANDPDVKGGALEVKVESGVVSLAGNVELQKQKDRATKVAKKVKGVKQVINNITVRPRAASR